MRLFLSSVLWLGSELRSSAQTVGGMRSDYCIEWLQQGGGHIDVVTPSLRLQNSQGQNARGTEQQRGCNDDRVVVGCIVAQGTGQVYTTDPEVCASATTAEYSGDSCRSDINTYGYTSNALSSDFTSYPAGWYDIKCPVLALSLIHI